MNRGIQIDNYLADLRRDYAQSRIYVDCRDANVTYRCLCKLEEHCHILSMFLARVSNVEENLINLLTPLYQLVFDMYQEYERLQQVVEGQTMPAVTCPTEHCGQRGRPRYSIT